MSAKTKKPPGRPALLSEAERADVARLYFDLGWTARRIREVPAYAHIRSDQGVRAMAASQRRKEFEAARDKGTAASGSSAQPPCDEPGLGPCVSDEGMVPGSPAPRAEAV